MLALLIAVGFAQDLSPEQLRAGKRLGAKPVAAWVYGAGVESTPPAGKRYVGADLDLKRFDPSIELSDIEAINISTKAAYGNPQFACVAPNGEWLDCATAPERVRVRLVWTVSDRAEKLRFMLWGRRLAGRVTIEPSGPGLPRRLR